MVTFRAAALSMASGGRLLATSSAAALHGEACAAAYASSKAGVIALVKTLAIELGPDITVNAVAPGQIRTAMSLADLDAVARRVGRTAEELLQDHLDRRVPAGRMGTPEEVASMFAYLASPEAGYVTGEVVRVDGGELAS